MSGELFPVQLAHKKTTTNCCRFPLGAAATIAKVVEAKEAIKLGAKEIDMVIRYSCLRKDNL